MNAANTIEVLNRLLVIHHRSLPMYLSYAAPWQTQRDQAAREVLDHIVADQKQMVDRIGELVLERDGDVEHGEFPMYFTGLHDLSFDYLVRRMIADQNRDVAAIEQCVDQLESDPLAKALAQECLGAAKGHLDSLEELIHPAEPAESS